METRTVNVAAVDAPPLVAARRVPPVRRADKCSVPVPSLQRVGLRQTGRVKTLVGLALGALLFVAFTSSAAGFSSLYVFGDGACTTTRNTNDGNPPEWYYGPDRKSVV